MSDEKFKEIVHSIRKVGMVTQVGAREFLCRKSSQTKISVAKSENIVHPENPNSCVFDGLIRGSRR